MSKKYVLHQSIIEYPDYLGISESVKIKVEARVERPIYAKVFRLFGSPMQITVTQTVSHYPSTEKVRVVADKVRSDLEKNMANLGYKRKYIK